MSVFRIGRKGNIEPRSVAQDLVIIEKAQVMNLEKAPGRIKTIQEMKAGILRIAIVIFYGCIRVVNHAHPPTAPKEDAGRAWKRLAMAPCRGIQISAGLERLKSPSHLRHSEQER